MTDRERDSLLDELRTDIPEMSDEAFNAGRSRLIDAIAQDTTATPRLLTLASSDRGKANRLWEWMSAAAVPVILALVVVVVNLGNDGTNTSDKRPEVVRPAGGLPPLPAEPHSTIGKLAEKVSDRADPPPSEYLYYKISTFSPNSSYQHEMWVPTQPGQVKLIWVTPRPGVKTETRTQWTHPLQLEKSPEAQYNAMRNKYGNAPHAIDKAFDEVMAYLTDPTLTPSNRRLLLHTLAYLPVFAQPGTMQPQDSEGTWVVTVNQDGTRTTEILFNLANGLITETKTTSTTPHGGSSTSTTHYSSAVPAPGIGVVPAP
jgi:hypothetical protein